MRYTNFLQSRKNIGIRIFAYDIKTCALIQIFLLTIIFHLQIVG